MFLFGPKSDRGTTFFRTALPQVSHRERGHGMGLTAAQLAAHFRGYAVQCLIVAQHQRSAGDRLTLIDMAQAWAALAEQAKRNEPLFAACDVSADGGGT